MTFYIPDDWVRGKVRIEDHIFTCLFNLTISWVYTMDGLFVNHLEKHGKKYHLLTLSSETKAIRVSFSDSDCLDFGAISESS